MNNKNKGKEKSAEKEKSKFRSQRTMGKASQLFFHVSWRLIENWATSDLSHAEEGLPTDVATRGRRSGELPQNTQWIGKKRARSGDQ